jgi:glucosamine kinase
MLIVCDSGSTKADWLVADGKKITDEFETIGFNPFFQDARTVFSELGRNATARRYRNEKGVIRFFGAGCSSRARNKVIHEGLARFFGNARVYVEHDMLGAALASCGNEKGLVCILGTGSNIAYFDGKRLSETRHGLGYVLGDEGSGSYFGKKLVSHFLYGTMPAALRRAFDSDYGLTRETAVKKVYHTPGANVFLASFAPFLSRHKRHRWIRGLVAAGLEEFFETNIAAYPQYKRLPVHFIGSIAYHFENALRETGRKCGFRAGKILVRPVDALMARYLNEADR